MKNIEGITGPYRYSMEKIHELWEGESGEEVKVLQGFLKDYGFNVVEDGHWGPQTERAVSMYFQTAAAKKWGFIPFTEENGLDLRTTNDDGPVGLRPGGAGRYSKNRTSEIQVVTIHWTAGPTTAKSLYNLFARTDRGVSSHWANDLTGTYQYLPMDASAWHAGWINNYSVGADICQPVQASRYQDAINAGYQVEKITNPSSRGHDIVLSLDPRIQEKTRSLMRFLSEYLDIPLKFPQYPDGTLRNDVVFKSVNDLGSWKGFVGHHHVSASKWDIAPWWEELVKPLM